jgi:rhamnose utilization protein RhaD (predicted bifunctional aldolase and dehydrogenase)
MTDQLDQLAEMTRALGQPHMEYVIIGEGNTSCRIDEDTFYIKASGQQMNGIGREGFVAVRFAPALELVESHNDDREYIQQAMNNAKVDPGSPARPSVEVTFHAILLAECSVKIIAHTHPIAANRILCSTRAEQFASNRLFPDECVLCGPTSVFVPYADPGLPLALAIRAKVRQYMERFAEAPKVILLANHGLIALAQTTAEALNITAMCVKAAHIFAGACAVGEPVVMSEADIMHIYKRPDEIYRRQRFVNT